MAVRPQFLPLLVSIGAVAGSGLAQGAAPRYKVEPTPQWIQSLAAPAPAGQVGDSARSAEYLLVDQQIRTDEDSQSYSRFVVRLDNPAGVEQESQITINYDPQREQLSLHAVKLLRDGQELDELRLGRIEVLQREENLEDGVLDGSLTFHLLMSDVRVGDTLDYSYTIERRNPEWGSRFYGRYIKEWTVPVKRSHLRIVTRAGAVLHLLDADEQSRSKKSQDGWDSLEWNWNDVPGRISEGGTPSWFDQRKIVQVSQFAGWSEIVRLSEPLYRITDKPTAELTALIARLRASGHTDEERALAALRFVQEEVRYTGVELGARAYRPDQPGEVLQRRYGDCKDKSLLAVALLRSLGIDAAPALVGTGWKSHVAERLPSPGIFNHAIVRARIDGATYWLDATESGQGGNLSRYQRSPFGVALVIAPGVTGLQSIPQETGDEEREVVTTEFDLRQGLAREATLTVSTEYHGSAADRMRRRSHAAALDKLANQYLNYYKRRYAGIRSAAPLQVKDDPQSNQLTVTESYRVGNLFEADDSGKQIFEIEAELVADPLKAPETPVRTTPLGLVFPADLTEHIKVRLPEDFPVKDDKRAIDGPGFHYESSVSHEGNDVFLDYHYQTLTDNVLVADLGEYQHKRQDARDDAYFQFTKTTHSAPTAAQAEDALKKFRAAIELTKQGQAEKADTELRNLLDSDGFRGLNDAQRHATFYLAGAVAAGRQDLPRALDLLKRSTEMEQSDKDEWLLRLETAARAGEHADAAVSLTTVATRWPDALRTLDNWAVARTVAQTPSAGSVRYGLLKALFDAGYSRPEFDGSQWWRDLALLQLEQGERGDAIKSLSAVTGPYAIISILADNRFLPVRSELGARLDVIAAAQRDIEAARQAVRQSPDKLAPVNRLADALRHSLRFEEALQVTDEVIARVNGPKGKEGLTDYNRQYVWILDMRTRALQALGRSDEAVAQEIAASHLQERDSDNVSQVINLAALYNDLGRPHDARNALAAVKSAHASAYGVMQIEIERLSSANQLADAAEEQRALEFLQGHRNDSISTYQRALISVNRQDEAAKLLIQRLANPDERIKALMEVQQFTDAAPPERVRELRRRWQAVVDRADVREAILKVGTIGSYAMLPESH